MILRCLAIYGDSDERLRRPIERPRCVCAPLARLLELASRYLAVGSLPSDFRNSYGSRILSLFPCRLDRALSHRTGFPNQVFWICLGSTAARQWHVSNLFSLGVLAILIIMGGIAGSCRFSFWDSLMFSYSHKRRN